MEDEECKPGIEGREGMLLVVPSISPEIGAGDVAVWVSYEEKDVDTAVGRVKEVDQDDYEGGEDAVRIHGGRCEEGVGIGESGFIYS